MDTISIAVGFGTLSMGLFVGYLIPLKKMRQMEAERQQKFNEVVESAKEKAKNIQYRARQEMKQTCRRNGRSWEKSLASGKIHSTSGKDHQQTGIGTR